MTDWQRSEPFCRWLQRRRRRRQQMAQLLIANAATDASRRIAQRVIDDWKVK